MAITGMPANRQENIQRTEAEYRRIDVDSASSLKIFAEDRKKYYRKFIMGELVEEEDSKAVTMGRMVETILFEAELFESKFTMSICPETPTGLMLEFCNALYTHTIENLDEEGVSTKPFAEICELAYRSSGYKRSLSWVLENFIDKSPMLYYREILASRPQNKTVITTEERDLAENIANRIRTNEFVGKFLESSRHVEIRTQLQIEGFEIDGLPLKAMLDLVVLNHHTKVATITDLKCVWSTEGFYNDYYLYRKAYIQGYVYLYALRYYLDNNGMADYSIVTPGFLVCDSSNYMDPLYFKMDEQDIKDAYLGFNVYNRYYKGVKEIIEELKWCKENNIWGISKKNFETRGIVGLKPL